MECFFWVLYLFSQYAIDLMIDIQARIWIQNARQGCCKGIVTLGSWEQWKSRRWIVTLATCPQVSNTDSSHVVDLDLTPFLYNTFWWPKWRRDDICVSVARIMNAVMDHARIMRKNFSLYHGCWIFRRFWRWGWSFAWLARRLPQNLLPAWVLHKCISNSLQEFWGFNVNTRWPQCFYVYIYIYINTVEAFLIARVCSCTCLLNGLAGKFKKWIQSTMFWLLWVILHIGICSFWVSTKWCSWHAGFGMVFSCTTWSSECVYVNPMNYQCFYDTLKWNLLNKHVLVGSFAPVLTIYNVQGEFKWSWDLQLWWIEAEVFDCGHETAIWKVIESYKEVSGGPKANSMVSTPFNLCWFPWISQCCWCFICDKW